MKTYFNQLDCLIDHGYSPTNKDAKDGEICMHQGEVYRVELLVKQFDGTDNPMYRRIDLMKKDIVDLYNEIQRIESERKEMKAETFPF